MGVEEREEGLDSQTQILSEQGGTLDNALVQFSKLFFLHYKIKIYLQQIAINSK